MSGLSIHQLTKKYRNGVYALKGIDLEIQSGDFFALLGANGAGKSTTIGIITSLISKTSGKVVVGGYDLDTHPYQVKSLIGLVPQEFNCNVFEKCELILTNQAGYYGLPRQLARERAAYYLNELGLWDKRHDTPRALSGGMKRRLMIARALVHQPKILILDEPTAGVDIEIRHGMWEFLKTLNQNGTTIILTTHYLEEAEHLCQNVAIIKQGKIALNQSMASLLDDKGALNLVLTLKQALSATPALQGFQCHLLASNKLEVSMTHESTLNQLFESLNQHQLEVTQIHHQKGRLEDLFLDIIKNYE